MNCCRARDTIRGPLGLAVSANRVTRLRCISRLARASLTPVLELFTQPMSRRHKSIAASVIVAKAALRQLVTGMN